MRAYAKDPPASSDEDREFAHYDLLKILKKVEQQLIVQALTVCKGNKSKAAQHLNIKRTTLIEKVKRLGISVSEEEAFQDEDICLADIKLNNTLRHLEHHLIHQTLRHTNGNRSHAARLLGIKRTTLVEKIKRLRESSTH